MAHWGYIEKRLADGKIVGWVCTPKPPQARKGYEWVEVEDQPVIEEETLLVKSKKVGEWGEAVANKQLGI